MREADVGSPSADTGRAISDHRISCPGLIWRRGSQSLMGNFGGSNRSSRWHWHQPRKGRCSDTDDHLSVRANVFRVAPESGHAETEAPCPKSAMCGRLRVGKSFFHVLQHWSVQPCVRPFNAVHMTAGHNALRGSGPDQQLAFKNAMAHVGCLRNSARP